MTVLLYVMCIVLVCFIFYMSLFLSDEGECNGFTMATTSNIMSSLLVSSISDDIVFLFQSCGKTVC